MGFRLIVFGRVCGVWVTAVRAGANEEAGGEAEPAEDDEGESVRETAGLVRDGDFVDEEVSAGATAAGEDLAFFIGDEAFSVAGGADDGHTGFDGAHEAGLGELVGDIGADEAVPPGAGPGGIAVPVVNGHDGDDAGSELLLAIGEVGEEALEAQLLGDGEAEEGDGFEFPGGGEVASGEAEVAEEGELVAEGDVFAEDDETGFVGVVPIFVEAVCGLVGDFPVLALGAEEDGGVGEDSAGIIAEEGFGGIFAEGQSAKAFGENDEVGGCLVEFAEEGLDGSVEAGAALIHGGEGHGNAGLDGGDDDGGTFDGAGHADAAEADQEGDGGDHAERVAATDAGHEGDGGEHGAEEEDGSESGGTGEDGGGEHRMTGDGPGEGEAGDIGAEGFEAGPSEGDEGPEPSAEGAGEKDTGGAEEEGGGDEDDEGGDGSEGDAFGPEPDETGEPDHLEAHEEGAEEAGFEEGSGFVAEEGEEEETEAEKGEGPRRPCVSGVGHESRSDGEDPGITGAHG